MSEFGRTKQEFLKTFLEFPNGIPSKDTIRRVFTAIDSAAFEQCFIQWVGSIANLSKGQVVAIDGKILCGAKSIEITAIPELLEILDIQDATITIDTMGTQKDSAKKIIDENANYILAVKENQAQLLQNIKDEFKFSKHISIPTKEDIDHGIIETRICSAINDFQFLNNNTDWVSLKSVVKVESIREFKNSDKPIEKATRYYISSLVNTPEKFQSDISSHWAIETN